MVVNTTPAADMQAVLTQVGDLPYDVPLLSCWVPGDDDAARRLGVIRYLVKPVSRGELLDALQRLVGDDGDVLIVDDEREILRLFSRMLSTAQRPYRVTWATDGQRALMLMRERHPDVVLLDLMMPGMDGFQVLQEKNRDASICDIPVVVVSSKDPSGDPIMSRTLTIARGNSGLSARELLECIQAVSQILSPTVRPVDLEQPENSDA
jgi:CheY-like chemotaxis protein